MPQMIGYKSRPLTVGRTVEVQKHMRKVML